MHNRLDIETPEGIGFSYQIADVGSRFLALFVDTLIQFGAIIVLILVANQLQLFDDLDQLPLGLSSEQFVAVLVVTIFLLYVLYFVAFELAWNGATPGKRLLRLRVVKENGYPLAALDVLLRNLVRLVDFFPAFYSLGVVVMLLNRQAKRLGDLAAGTLVVRTRDDVKLDTLSLPLPMNDTILNEHQQRLLNLAQDAARNLSSDDAELIESYLSRYDGLTNRDALGERISHAIAAQLAAPDLDALTADLSDADFLRLLLRAYRQRMTVRSEI